MEFVRIRKGYQVNITGMASPEMADLAAPSRVAVLPERIPFIKPRMLVGIGDRVNVGTVLFEDKRNTDLKFLSPGSGEVVEINYGPRRMIKEVVINLDTEERYENFESLDSRNLAHIERDRLIRIMMRGGLWPLVRELPFRDIARPDVYPPAIFVSLGAKEPFHPQPEVYLKGKTDLFEYGIHVLRKLARTVHVMVCRDNVAGLKNLNGLVTHTYSGNYPADDPGVLLYHIRKSSEENRAWYVTGQDVLLLAHLLKFGRYPTERIMVLAGSSATQRLHLKTRLGASLDHLAKGRFVDGQLRYIVGGLFRGYKSTEQSYMGFYETSLTLIPEGREREFLALVKPGFNKPSYSRAFLSVFNKADFMMDCNLHGGRRACIGCGFCAEVCPVDILPQLAYKSILAEDTEESLAHGLLDCVECGLCSYVCPSKIELFAALKAAKAEYYAEQT